MIIQLLNQVFLPITYIRRMVLVEYAVYNLQSVHVENTLSIFTLLHKKVYIIHYILIYSEDSGDYHN